MKIQALNLTAMPKDTNSVNFISNMHLLIKNVCHFELELTFGLSISWFYRISFINFKDIWRRSMNEWKVKMEDNKIDF